jgi:hypothetical protein
MGWIKQAATTAFAVRMPVVIEREDFKVRHGCSLSASICPIRHFLVCRALWVILETFRESGEIVSSSASRRVLNS